jgi:cellulose synthase/poly-beta-1,6-N-acetylglucosamine synthase-like glycosyltransferase
MEGLSLIIPAYNEADRIYETVRESVRSMEALNMDYEIIVVDDGSTDGTARVLERVESEFPKVTHVSLPENEGKGYATRRGFQASTKNLVCLLDADLDIHPYQVQHLLREMQRTGVDVVVGSKRHPASTLEYPRSRRFYSTVYYYLLVLLFHLPLKDTQTGIKLFKREVLTSVFPRIVSMCYVMDLELLLVANFLGYHIAEAPVKISFQREYGRITWEDIRGILVDTMSLFYRFYVLGYYGSPLKPVVDYEPRISIVVPTRDIDWMIEECVAKCGELNYSEYDIRLVPDRAAEIDLPRPGSRVIASGQVGPAIKRNLAVEDSTAEIIAFIDGDAFPEYDWLRNAVPYFEDESIAAVGGPAITPNRDNRRQHAGGAVFSATMVSGNTRYRYRPHALREVDDYPTVNLLVRKSDFEAVGGFHTEFWPGEDTVLCHKLTQDLTKRIVYVPNVLVYHHRRALFVPHLRQVYSYAVHRGFFVKKFPETSRKPLFFVPTLFVLALLAGLAASFFSTVFLIAYLSAVGLYLSLVLVSSIKTLSLSTNFLVFPGIIATHITYGVGFLVGLLSSKMKEQ